MSSDSNEQILSREHMLNAQYDRNLLREQMLMSRGWGNRSSTKLNSPRQDGVFLGGIERQEQYSINVIEKTTLQDCVACEESVGQQRKQHQRKLVLTCLNPEIRPKRNNIKAIRPVGQTRMNMAPPWGLAMQRDQTADVKELFLFGCILNFACVCQNVVLLVPIWAMAHCPIEAPFECSASAETR